MSIQRVEISINSAAPQIVYVNQGPPGQTGTAATVTVGTTTTGNAGTNASVTNSGTTSAAIFNFTIPRGATGAAGPNSVTVATTSDGTATLSLSTLTVGSAATFNATTYTFGTGAASAMKTSLAISSGDVTFNSAISVTGANSSVSTTGTNASIYTSGGNAPIIANASYVSANYFKFNPDNDSNSTRIYTLASGGSEEVVYFPDESGIIAVSAIKSANFTAANGCDYIATATLTVTDPSPSEGAAFRVLVRNGTATVGATAYSVAGTVIERVYHSGAWANYSYSSALFGAGVATFLTTPSSANLAAAVTDETGTGSLVFATSPTIVTPTISRGSVGQVFTAQDNNGVTTTMTTDSFGRNFLQVNGKSGGVAQSGAYITASGFEEAWAYVNCLSNTSGQRVMRFGNLSNRFSIQRLNDAISSITATPFSIANDAPTNTIYITTSGNIGFGTSSDFGGGAKVWYIANATTVPTTNPTGGGLLYVEGGALKYRGSSGTVTIIAPA